MGPWVIVAFLIGFILGVFICVIGASHLQDEYEGKIKNLEAKIKEIKD